MDSAKISFIDRTSSPENVIERIDNLPFGEELAPGVGRGSLYTAGIYPASGGPINQKFSGKERDAESGLDFFEARICHRHKDASQALIRLDANLIRVFESAALE